MGSWKWGVGSWKWGVGSGKLEVGSWKWEAGSWKWEVGSSSSDYLPVPRECSEKCVRPSLLGIALEPIGGRAMPSKDKFL